MFIVFIISNTFSNHAYFPPLTTHLSTYQLLYFCTGKLMDNPGEQHVIPFSINKVRRLELKSASFTNSEEKTRKYHQIESLFNETLIPFTIL